MKRLWIATAAACMLVSVTAFAGMYIPIVGDGAVRTARASQRTGNDARGNPASAAPMSETVSKAADAADRFRLSDVIDSRITFVFADDNIFAGSSDFSPSADIGARSKIKTFFDNYDTKDTGQETKTNFVLYRKFKSRNPRVETEAGLVARFDFFTDEQTGRPDTRLSDDGSFLQAAYKLGPLNEFSSRTGDGPRIYVLAFPFNADRMRLGYSFDITWGGNKIFPGNSAGAPGLKAGWQGKKAYAFAGIKSHRQLNDLSNRIDAVYGFLGGFGYDFTPNLRWEVNGGLFQKGVFPELGQGTPLDGEAITAQGISTQVTFTRGFPVETSVDLRLYRNDPRFPWRAFRRQTRSEDVSFLVSSEVTFLTQTLRDPDVFGQTESQIGLAGDVNFRIKKGFTRFSADIVYRNVEFILFNVPSFVPFYGFPDSAVATPERFVAVGVDYYIERFRLNPGVVFGYQTPATYVGDAALLNPSDPTLTGQISTVVVRRQGDFDILPQGQSAFDIMSLRGFTRWDLSDGMSIIGEVTYTLDKNATTLQPTSFGGVIRVFEDPNVVNRLAVALIMQARF